jgi:hypothetical protein
MSSAPLQQVPLNNGNTVMTPQFFNNQIAKGGRRYDR